MKPRPVGPTLGGLCLTTLALLPAACSPPLEQEAEEQAPLSGGLSPTDDTHVRSGSNAGVVYGQKSEVSVDGRNSGDELRGFLKFRVEGTGTLERAILHLYVTNPTDKGPNVHRLDDTSWSEETATWNRQPAMTGGAVAMIGKAKKGWLEVDVTSAVRLGAVVSLGLAPRSSDGFAFKSKEASGSGYAPRLMLQLAGASDAGVPLADAGVALDSGAAPPDAGAPNASGWAECLARPGTTTQVVSGTHDKLSISNAPDNWNLDLSAATFVGYPDISKNPVTVNLSNPGSRDCIGGGQVLGQQALDKTWYEMHDVIGGGGFRIYTGAGAWRRIDGIRAYNVEDGLKPRGPDGVWELWNAYMTYIRDDCIENDEMAPGSVHDSLFDGCYTGFSEQLQTTEELGAVAAGEVFVVERTLMRLQKMPGPYQINDPSVLGHGKFFKWQAPKPHPVQIRDSIFLAETQPNGSVSSNWPFPPGTTTTNVTIVWRGSGAWTWSVPPGTTVTTDIGVWNKARQRWLDRHGCTELSSCTKLLAPDPWP